MACGDITYVRKANGTPVALIQESTHGKQLTLTSGRYLGRWDRASDITTNEHGGMVGRGDVLTTLLPPGILS